MVSVPEKGARVTRKGSAWRGAHGAARWRCMIPRLLSPAAESGSAPEKFEDLLGRLEQIVADMENAEMPLEKLLAGYEEGMRLVKACGERLADAEQKVEILSRAAGVAEPAKVPAAPAGAPPAKAEDIKLF